MSYSAQQMLDFYIQAERDVLEGRTVTQNGRTLTMVDLPAIRQGRQEWERKVAQQRSVGASGPGFARFL